MTFEAKDIRRLAKLFEAKGIRPYADEDKLIWIQGYGWYRQGDPWPEPGDFRYKAFMDLLEDLEKP